MTSHSHTNTPEPINLADDQGRFKFLWADPRPLVIMLLPMRRQIMTAKQIAVYLGSNPETVTQKLRVLSSLNLVTRPQVRGGWMLTADGWRFMLQSESADNPRFVLSSATSSNSIKCVNAVVVSNNADSCRKKPGKRGKSALSNKQLELIAGVNADVVAEMRHWGISINAHTAEIARRDYITPELVYSHAMRLRKRGKSSTGLLIQILDDNDQLTREDLVSAQRYEDVLYDRQNNGYCP